MLDQNQLNYVNMKKSKKTKVKKYGFGGVSALRGSDGNVMNEPAKTDAPIAGQPLQTAAPSTYGSVTHSMSNASTGFGSNQPTGLLGPGTGGGGSEITINNTQTPAGDLGQQDPGIANTITAKKGKMVTKLSTGGLLRQGKPRLALRGWK